MRLSAFTTCLLSLFFLASCGEPEPTPAVLDLVNGTVRTHMEAQVPLKHWREEGVTQVMLVPMPEAGTDPARGPLSLQGRKLASAIATYAMGFEPETVLAPDSPAGIYAGNVSASLNKITTTNYPAEGGANAIAEQLSGMRGKRVVVFGTPAQLAEAFNDFAGESTVDWPSEGESAFVYATAGGNEATSQPFAIRLDYN